MASYSKWVDAGSRGKRWHARRKRDGVVYHLGWFATREEAERAEANFDKFWPPYGRTA